MGVEEVLIPLFIFSSIAAVSWKFIDSRHKERMTLIEKGLVNEDLKHLYRRFEWKANPYTALKFGMLAAFIGAGILVSAFLSPMFFSHEEQMTTGIIFLSGGLGLIAFYGIVKKKMESETIPD